MLRQTCGVTLASPWSTGMRKTGSGQYGSMTFASPQVRGHNFRFASGDAIHVEGLNFNPEQVIWSVTSEGGEAPVTLAVASHPNWRARLNDAPISIRETEDHLMEVRIPRGTSTLTLAFRRAWWETLLLAISVTTFGVSLLLWLRGCQKARWP